MSVIYYQYINPHSQVKPGKLTKYNGLISNSLIDTFLKFSKTQLRKITLLLKKNFF